MADPILPDFFRAQLVLQHKSGKPEDQFVNSFVFRNDAFVGSSADFAAHITNVLEDWLFVVQASGASIANHIPNVIASGEVRCYDLGEATPRTPMINPIDPSKIGLFSTAAAYPFEVAVCVSWLTDTKGPRGRGRNFIGPLTTTTSQKVGDKLRVSTSFMNTLGQASAIMARGTNHSLHVLSKANQSAALVTSGYVDNEFDTQRRRGTPSDVRGIFQVV